MKTCETCRYWEIIGSETIKAGHCTCMPPQVVSADGKTLWPITRAESGCGEHRDKPALDSAFGLNRFLQDRVAYESVIANWIDYSTDPTVVSNRDMRDWFRDCVARAEAYYRGEEQRR